MRKSEIEEMSADQIKALMSKLDNQLKEAEKRQSALTEIKSFIEKQGFTLAEFIKEVGIGSGKEKVAARVIGPAAAKYKSLSNPDLTWSGRGKQPKWLVAELKSSGKDLSDFAI